MIHWLVPSASAVRPSSEAATFSRSQGRPRSMRETKPMLSSRASSPPRAGLDDDAGGGEPRRALPGDQRIRIAHGDDDAADAGGDQRVGAGRRAAVVRARLERDVDGRAAHVVAARRRVAQGHDLGVRAAGLLRVAAAEHACRRRRR